MQNLFKIAFIIFIFLTQNAYAQTNNVCTLLKNHAGWASSLEKAQEKWGISQGAILSVIDQESRFKANATNGIYRGFSQASPQTWAWFLRDTKIGNITRADFDASAYFVGWHFKTMSKKLGIPMSNVTAHYLAYKLGEGGYRKGGSKSAQNIAIKVARRAEMFDNQLSKCGL